MGYLYSSYRYITGDLLEELAYAAMKAEKSNDRLSASWRNLEVGSTAQSKSAGLRSWGADGLT